MRSSTRPLRGRAGLPALRDQLGGRVAVHSDDLHLDLACQRGVLGGERIDRVLRHLLRHAHEVLWRRGGNPCRALLAVHATRTRAPRWAASVAAYAKRRCRLGRAVDSDYDQLTHNGAYAEQMAVDRDLLSVGVAE
jgi:hypothetical protein